MSTAVTIEPEAEEVVDEIPADPRIAQALTIVAHLWGVTEEQVAVVPARCKGNRHGSPRAQEARAAWYFVLQRLGYSLGAIGVIVEKSRSTVLKVTAHLANKKMANPHLFERLNEACSVVGVPLPPPAACILFVGFMTGHRAGDFLPGFRRGTDLCQRSGCCRMRADHLAARHDAAYPIKEPIT